MVGEVSVPARGQSRLGTGDLAMIRAGGPRGRSILSRSEPRRPGGVRLTELSAERKRALNYHSNPGHTEHALGVNDQRRGDT